MKKPDVEYVVRGIAIDPLVDKALDGRATLQGQSIENAITSLICHGILDSNLGSRDFLMSTEEWLVMKRRIFDALGAISKDGHTPYWVTGVSPSKGLTGKFTPRMGDAVDYPQQGEIWWIQDKPGEPLHKIVIEWCDEDLVAINDPGVSHLSPTVFVWYDFLPKVVKKFDNGLGDR